MSVYDVVLAGRPEVDGDAPGWFSLRTEGWRALMQLGHAYGWEPAGTVPDAHQTEFSGNSDTGSTGYDVFMADAARCVTAADATRWADALERALRGDGTPTQQEARRTVLREDLQDSLHPSLQVVSDFVGFLRRGAFAFYYTH